MSETRSTDRTTVSGHLGGLNLQHRGRSALTGATAREEGLKGKRPSPTITGKTVGGAAAAAGVTTLKAGAALVDDGGDGDFDQLRGQATDQITAAGGVGLKRGTKTVGKATSKAASKVGDAVGLRAKAKTGGKATGRAARGGLTMQRKNAAAVERSAKTTAQAGKAAASAYRGITSGLSNLRGTQQAVVLALRTAQATYHAVAAVIGSVVTAKVWLIALVVIIVLGLILTIMSFLPSWGEASKNEGRSYCEVGSGEGTEVDNVPKGPIVGYGQSELKNAAIIIAVARATGFEGDGETIGLITGMQESTLGAMPGYDKPNGDGDAGIFQQRQLEGWYGSLEQVNDVVYASNAFYKGVTADAPGDYGSVGGGKGHGHIPGLADIDGWENMAPGDAAQAVQKSAYPDEYAKHVDNAKHLIQALANTTVTLGEGDCGGGTGETTHPAPLYPMTSPFGYRIHPISKKRKLHSGIDFGVPCGGQIFAWDNGKVTYTGHAGGYGNRVEIDHGNGIISTYSHGTSIPVQQGDQIKGGDLVLIGGTTGASTGCHLHFEIKKNGGYVDPAPYLPRQ